MTTDESKIGGGIYGDNGDGFRQELEAARKKLVTPAEDVNSDINRHELLEVYRALREKHNELIDRFVALDRVIEHRNEEIAELRNELDDLHERHDNSFIKDFVKEALPVILQVAGVQSDMRARENAEERAHEIKKLEMQHALIIQIVASKEAK